MKLYHYFEKEKGPFCNLSDLHLADAEKVLGEIRKENQIYASKRDETYIRRRFEYEDLTRKLFIAKGGKVIRNRPHYMTVEACEWLKSWYKEGCFLLLDQEEMIIQNIGNKYTHIVKYLILSTNTVFPNNGIQRVKKDPFCI